MVAPLLQTKLYVPTPRSDLVPRPRLVEQLNEGAHRTLTLVSAPAGFGKTTLLSNWLQDLADGRFVDPVRPAWLSLDEGDNDLARFLAYLIAALRTAQIGVGQAALTALQSRQRPATQAVLTALINDLAALNGADTPEGVHIVLILDDYHLITSPEIHNALSFLLDHRPPTLRLVIATRADPPLPIARLRASGQLTEIRQADLRFTQAEVATFLTTAVGLEITDEQITTLGSRTEGWIAGLQMAAASMKQRENLGAFVDTFAGSHRYVMDYLMEEVLLRQPPEVQAFLLQTSILERLSTSLCDAVLLDSPPSSSQPILAHLDQTNLFVTPLDDRRMWYRYHRLFADLLRRRLSERYPDLVPGLHRRASQWYEDQDLLAESIEHALAAADFERSASLIGQVIETLMMRSELTTLRNWLDALPEKVLHRWPQLCAYHAWLLLLAGEPFHAVESRLTAISEHADGESGQLMAVRALVSVYRGQIEGVPGLVEKALQTLSEEDRFWCSMAKWLRNLLRLSDSELQQDDAQALRQLIHSGLDSQNLLLSVIGLCNLGELRVKQGRLNEAEAFFETALSRATDMSGKRLPIAGEPLIWLGDLARERNELPMAARCLTEGLELIQPWGSVAAIEGYIALARLRHAQDDEAAVSEALEEAERLAVMFDATEMDDHLVAMTRARIAALNADFGAVDRWTASRGLDALDPEDLQLDATAELHLRKYELTVLGLARILEGRPREALTVLDPVLSWVAGKGRWGLGIEILALQAAAHRMMGDPEEALSRLESALARAKPEGYVRLFLDIEDPMPRLLYQAVQRGIYPEYAARLLGALPEPPQTPTPAVQKQVGIEPLSERELEVLTAIAEGLTNQETAQRLYISERTVKWHASNIYGKLQVRNRTEAVARARALGILPT